MLAVFRTDASTILGGGHATRCLTLAHALAARGWHCAFAVNPEAPDTVPGLRAFDLQLLDMPPADQPAALHKHWPGGADWLVVDHYGLDGDWESRCRGWARAITVLDDLADRQHDCDLLVDQTFGRNGGDYDGLFPAGCRRLTGSDYALLRPEFARARPAALARRAMGPALRRLLVSLGATDPENHTREVLQGIAESRLPLQVDVVLGPHAPHLEAVRQQCKTMPQGPRLHVDVQDISALLSEVDLAIGAAGTSTWERCCLGLPSLLLVIADNQRHVAEAVSASGAARLLPGPRPAIAGQVAAALRQLATDPSARQTMATEAAKICDGRGCDRVGLALVAPGRAKDGRAVALRLAAPCDEATILDWQKHPTTRRFARNPSVPTAEEHHRWFTARLTDADALLTIITLDGTPAGVLRLDPMVTNGARPAAPVFEVSILIDPNRRSLGIALEALRFLRRWQAAAVIAATVLPGNDASSALFRRAGYAPADDGLLYSRPAVPAVAEYRRKGATIA